MWQKDKYTENGVCTDKTSVLKKHELLIHTLNYISITLFFYRLIVSPNPCRESHCCDEALELGDGVGHQGCIAGKPQICEEHLIYFSLGSETSNVEEFPLPCCIGV